MKYGYTVVPFTYDTQGRPTGRPLIEVTLVANGRSTTAVGLIDSGADTSLVNIGYARYLDITLDSKHTQPFLGIAGEPVECFIHHLTLVVRPFDIPITIPVGFVDSNSVDVLLGQEGFFDAYHIAFKKGHGTFELFPTPRKK